MSNLIKVGENHLEIRIENNEIIFQVCEYQTKLYDRPEYDYAEIRFSSDRNDDLIAIKDEIDRFLYRDKLDLIAKNKVCAYQLYIDCGRQGEIEGVFHSTKKDIEKVTGKKANFYELVGKHSDITITASDEYVKLLTEDPLEVFRTQRYGSNLFEHIDCDECCEPLRWCGCPGENDEN